MVIAGIIAAIGLPVLGQWGFTETCSQEILGISITTFLSLPGLITAYIGRLRQGDINAAGIKRSR